jgi:hypothetical protein
VESYNTDSEYCGRVSPSELQLAESFCLVVLATCEEGASSSFGLVFQLGSSCYCIRFICLLYLLYSTFFSPHLYTHIPNWFSLGGFYPGPC